MEITVKQRSVLLVQIFSMIINVIAVTAISGFIYYTTELIRKNYQARDFLDRVQIIPDDPQKMFFECLTLMLILIISFFVRHYYGNSNSHTVIITLFVDFVVTLLSLFILNFNYNGLLLLVFAEILYYIKDRKLRIILIILAVLGYLIGNYDFLSLRFNMFNIKDYVGYYSSSSQQYIMSIINITISLNIIVFIMYCVMVMNVQSDTIDEVNKLYHELQSANEQLQEYASMSERMAQTRERNRLAREIHDTLGHTLTGITAGIDACITTIDISPDLTKKQLELLSKVSRDGIKDIRRSVSELRPDTVERLHLEVAIRKMITDMSQVSGAQILFETDEKKLRFDEDEENAIYRVIQESITNALRHGAATKIRISIERKDGDLILKIKDNGVGCKEIKSGFGTRHIQERIEMLHGTVSFDGSNGFTVSAIIPIRWGENYD